MKNFLDLTLQDNKKVTISKAYIVLIEPLENGKTRLTVDMPGSKDTKHFFTNEVYSDLIKRLD